MRFHTRLNGDAALELPLLLGHFLPWFTLEGDGFDLEPSEREDLEHLPVLADMRHWRDPGSGYARAHLHLPAPAVYDSRDPKLIRWQIHTALDCGLSGFIINWYGKHSAENVIALHWSGGLRAWNEAHPERPFYYFISFDSQAQRATEGKHPVSMVEDFRYIKEHLITDAYLLRDGRPIFSTFPHEDNCPAWRAALDEVFGPGGADLVWMNDSSGRGENAAYPWVRPDGEVLDYGRRHAWRDPNNVGVNWLREFYAGAAAGVEYIMGGVWPGFDDQLVAWAWNGGRDQGRIRPRVICRETMEGNTLERTWDVYLDYLRAWVAGDAKAATPAPLVQVVTWNDYAEASSVEPARDYGTGPLDICRRRIEAARDIWKSARPFQTVP